MTPREFRPKFIMLHHSLTKDGDLVSWGAIRRFHISWRHEGRIISEQAGLRLRARGEHVEAPWSDIGYAFGIEQVATASGFKTYEILKGRSLFSVGAHCATGNMNRLAIGVCLVGSWDQAEPPLEMFRRLKDLCDELRELFPDVEDFNFHRDFAPWKTCPGTKVTRELIEEHVWRP